MRNCLVPFVFLIALCVLLPACAPDRLSDEAAGIRMGPFLGEPPPGSEATLFAPGFISTGLHDRDVAMTPDGNEFYFSVFLEAQQRFTFAIMVSARRHDGSWSEPRVAGFSGRYNDVEPCISADGSQFLFVSNRPLQPGGEPLDRDVNIWSMNRDSDGWGKPVALGTAINTSAMEAFPSLTADGTLYFTRNDEAFTRSDIYRSRLADGVYRTVEKLPETINAAQNPFNAFIAPDESYLIFSAYDTPGSFGASDYLISFRSDDDLWSEPVNLGPEINSVGKETSPYVTRDGAYFFFASDRGYFDGDGFFTRPMGTGNRQMSYEDFAVMGNSAGNGRHDIYWIDASVLTAFRDPDVAAGNAVP